MHQIARWTSEGHSVRYVTVCNYVGSIPLDGSFGRTKYLHIPTCLACVAGLEVGVGAAYLLP